MLFMIDRMVSMAFNNRTYMLNPEKPLTNVNSQETAAEANLKITVNPNAYNVLDVLVDSYLNRCPPYNEAVLPQELKPNSLKVDGSYFGSHQHAMYFWNVCSYMSGRVKSDVAFKRMTDIFNESPELFDCQTLAGTDPAMISKILKNHGLGRQNMVANNWVENAQKLVDKYDGDPRNIFDGIVSYDDCVDRIKCDKDKGFHGFREKMTSMILYFFMDEGLVTGIDFPPPVDFHVQRIALATEMISIEPQCFHKCSAIEDTLRELFKGYLDDRHTDPLDLTNAIWTLSSSFCNQSAGNSSSVVRSNNETICTSEEIDPNNLRQSEMWRKSCGRCAIEKYCNYYVPATPYYKKGVISLRQKTVKDFAEQLSFFSSVK
jgi:endonuclease III